jgi:hypothetical protein
MKTLLQHPIINAIPTASTVKPQALGQKTSSPTEVTDSFVKNCNVSSNMPLGNLRDGEGLKFKYNIGDGLLVLGLGGLGYWFIESQREKTRKTTEQSIKVALQETIVPYLKPFIAKDDKNVKSAALNEASEILENSSKQRSGGDFALWFTDNILPTLITNAMEQGEKDTALALEKTINTRDGKF